MNKLHSGAMLFIKLLVLHSHTIGIIIVIAALLLGERITVVTLLLYLTFTVLLKQETSQNKIKAWYLLGGNCVCIIVAQYTTRIFKDVSVEKRALEILGLSLSQDAISSYEIRKNEELASLVLYAQPFTLLTVSIMVSKIQGSEMLTNLLSEYFNWEELLMPQVQFLRQQRRDYDEDLGFVSENQVTKQVDILSRILASTNLYLLLMTLAFTSVALPLSAPSLMLLGTMTLIILKSISTQYPNDVYKSTKSWVFQLVGLLSTATAAAQLFSAFLVDFQIGLKAEYSEAQKTSSAEWWSLIMGVDEQLFEWRILALFSMIGFSAVAVKMTNNPLIYLVKPEADHLQDSDAENSSMFRQTAIYFVYGCQLSLPVVLIVAVFTIALSKPSLWGTFSLITLLILIWKEQQTFWRQTYFTIGILTQFEAMITYSLEFFLMLLNQVDPNISNGESYTEKLLRKNLQLMADKEILLFNQLTWLFLILFLCFVQQALLKFAEDFHKSQNRDIVRKCLAFKLQFLDVFSFTQGVTVTLIILLITMLCKRNLSSFIFLPLFIGIFSIQFYPHRVSQEPEIAQDYLLKMTRVRSWMTYLICLTKILIISEYLISYFLLQEDSQISNDTNSKQQQFKEKWTEFARENLCYMESQYGGSYQCVNDWTEFVGLGKKTHTKVFYFLQILLLLSTYIARAFTCPQAELDSSQILDEPQLGDKFDFTIATDGVFFNKCIYGYFPYFLISCTLVCTSSLNPGNNSTLLSCYYLVLIFSISIRFRKLFQRNLKVLQYLRALNLSVLVGQLIFQIPAIPCPYDVDGTLYYISAKNCPVTSARNESTNPYVLFMHTLGFFKMHNTPIALVVLHLICELQASFFAHPYFTVYVLGRQRITKYDGRMRAFMFVQNYHLKTRWAFEAVSEQVKLLHSKLQRTVSLCENVIPREQTAPEEQSLKQEDTEFELSNQQDICEKICAESLTGLRPAVSISQLYQIKLAKADQSEDEIIQVYRKELETQQNKLEVQQKEDLFNVQGLGLQFALDSINLLPNEHEFYYDAIVKRSQLKPEKTESSGSQMEEDLQLEYQDKSQVSGTELLNLDHSNLEQPATLSFWHGIDSKLRQFLLNSCNEVAFISLLDPASQQTKQPQKIGYMGLLFGAFAGKIEQLCLAVMCIVFAANSNLITSIFPLISLLVGTLQIKTSRSFWQFVTWYNLGQIMLKIVVQLPIFCSTPAWSFTQCSDEEIPPDILVQRYDFVIGLQKFYGPSSYPRDQGIFRGLFWDLVLMVMLINLQRFFWKIGRWQFVQNSDNIQTTPFLKPTESERSDQTSKAYWESLKGIFTFVKLKLLILLPQQMKESQPNLDMRNVDAEPLTLFDPKRFKPGKDYFNGTFYTLLAIFFYTLLFFKQIIGKGGQDLADGTKIELNHFTIWQVLLLFVLMCLMLVERMLYRVKQDGRIPKHALTARFIIYLCEVLAVHIIFTLVWPFRSIRLSQNISVKIYYFFWLSHFAYSALQIRHGYPIAPYRQTFLRDTSPKFVWLYRIYRAIPFLWEMKVIIDWTVTTTCLDLFQWFRFDDAAQYLFYSKYCSDERATQPEFQSRRFSEKLWQGFCFAFGLVLLVLAPILLFSDFNGGLMENQVQSGQLEIKFNLGGFNYELYTGRASQLATLTDSDITSFEEQFKVVNDSDQTQIQKISFPAFSEQNWQISDPMLEQLMMSYENNKAGYVTFESSWKFQRQAPLGAEQTGGKQVQSLPIQQLKYIFELLETNSLSNATDASVVVPNLFPNILRLDSSKATQNLEVISSSGQQPPEYSFASLVLHKSNRGNFYWTFQPTLVNSYQSGPQDELQIFLFNDSVATTIFYDTGAFSVIGLYVTLVYAVGSFLRIIFDRYSQRVIYEELPDTEKLRQICEGICIAQQEGDLRTEKYLYDLLILIYRNPKLMLKMTGLKNQYQLEQSYNDFHSKI